MRKPVEPQPIPIKAYRALQAQGRERQEKMRPDHILMVREMKENPEYIRIEKKKYEEQQERYHKLWRIINGLSRMQKACFVMHHDMGFSVRQLAKDFKVSESTVKEHLKRAKHNLRKNLSPGRDEKEKEWKGT